MKMIYHTQLIIYPARGGCGEKVRYDHPVLTRGQGVLNSAFVNQVLGPASSPGTCHRRWCSPNYGGMTWGEVVKLWSMMIKEMTLMERCVWKRKASALLSLNFSLLLAIQDFLSICDKHSSLSIVLSTLAVWHEANTRVSSAKWHDSDKWTE